MHMQLQMHKHEQAVCPSSSKVRHEVCVWNLLQHRLVPSQDNSKLPRIATYQDSLSSDESVVNSTTRDFSRSVSEHML